MKKLRLLLTTFVLAIFSHVNAQYSNNEIWIDVRTAKEYQQGHLEGAVNIPHIEIQQHIAEITDDKHAPIHLYCVAGIRAEIAKNALESLGYKNVVNEGGIKDLKVTQ